VYGVRAEPLTDAAEHLAELADEVETTRARVVLTRPGHADVVLLSADELTSLEETVALANDAQAQQHIAEAETAYAAGDYMTGDELRARYGLPPRVA
jgi:antitoxin YefM